MSEYKIVCVPTKQIPPPPEQHPPLHWQPLFEQLFLRLEQTPPRDSLCVILPLAELHGAAIAVKRMFNSHVGRNAVHLEQRRDGDTGYLYVRRGRLWNYLHNDLERRAYDAS